jgi:hypothetical protein
LVAAKQKWLLGSGQFSGLFICYKKFNFPHHRVTVNTAQ